MGDFAPTIEKDAKRFGFPHSRIEYPAGVAGVRLSLTEVARRVYEGARSPSIQQFSEMIIRSWAKVPPSQRLTNRQATQILLDYVRLNVRYRPDPPNVEMTKSASILLCVPGAQMCIPVGDCDDEVVALGSLTAAYGIETRVIKQTFGSDDQEHVLIAIQDDDGTWLPADPSAGPDKPVGWKANATHEDVIDPSDPKSIQLVGAHEAEFIGVGSLGRRITVFIGTPSPYAARIGVGASPIAPSHYELVPSLQTQTGRRYRVGMLVNFIGHPDAGEGYVRLLLGNDWAIETLSATGDITGGIQSWILEGVAQRDMQLGPGPQPPAPFVISYLVLAVQMPGSAVAVTTTTTPPSSVGATDLAVKGFVTAAVVGLAWRWWSLRGRR